MRNSSDGMSGSEELSFEDLKDAAGGITSKKDMNPSRALDKNKFKNNPGKKNTLIGETDRP